ADRSTTRPSRRTAETSRVDIAPNDPLVMYLMSAPGPVALDGLQLDSPAVRDLRAAGVKLVVPLVSQGELIGTFNLGPHLSDQEYSVDDRRLLDKLAAQAAQFTDWTQSLVSRVAEQVEELQRVERLRRFLAPQVAQVVAHDEKLLESHRREIAAVFCDLRGFTAFSEVAEPEEVMSVLREYHDALGALVFEFEATLERFAGDAILAFFNDPVPCPDPAARAVRMAVAMRERVGELVVDWRKRGHDLDFGVGIALGYATLGRIGFAGRSDYGAVGTVVNLAARLCAEALGGQILLSERAHRLVEDLVEAEPLAPLRLKGFLRPVNAVNVVALRAGQ
ncbi:MAG: GAF domain-containing protein, partial [Chloroflexi bacterium]